MVCKLLILGGKQFHSDRLLEGNIVDFSKQVLVSSFQALGSHSLGGCRRISNEVFHVYGAAGHEQTTARPGVR